MTPKQSGIKNPGTSQRCRAAGIPSCKASQNVHRKVSQNRAQGRLMTRFPAQMHALHGVGMLKLLYKHICVIKIKMSDFPWLPPMVSSVCYTDKSLFSQCIQLNVELQGLNTKTENEHNKIQLSNSSQSSIESCSEVQHTYSCREYSPSSMSAADPFCSMLTEPWSNTAPVVINLNNTSLVLQCFDAVGWVAGRASGL